MLALNSLIAVLSLYLMQRFSLNADNVGPVYFVFSAVGVVMRVHPVGWINERLGEVRTMRLGAVLLGIGLLLMPLPTTLLGFMVCLILAPIGTALLFPASTALVSHRTDPNQYGVQMGAQQTLRGVMAIVGPIGATLAFQHLGPGSPFLLSAAFVALAALVAAVVRQLGRRSPRCFDPTSPFDERSRWLISSPSIRCSGSKIEEFPEDHEPHASPRAGAGGESALLGAGANRDLRVARDMKQMRQRAPRPTSGPLPTSRALGDGGPQRGMA
jgi:MFS family permease